MALLSRQAKEWLGQKHILGFISHRVISGGCQPRPLVGKCPLFGFSAVGLSDMESFSLKLSPIIENILSIFQLNRLKHFGTNRQLDGLTHRQTSFCFRSKDPT